jgi:hypothetical protein
MEVLDAAIASVRGRIERHGRDRLSEQDTKNAFIEPVLRALGWDLEDLEEVRLEYKRKPSDNPVDYALFLLRTPRLFVEAKALGARLDDRKWANQIIAYATMAGVGWVVLTDGDEYRIYNSHAAVPVEEKLFRQVRITAADVSPAETLALLSKEQLTDNLIDSIWQTQFVDRQVRTAVEGLFSPDPDPAFVRLLRRKRPNLSAADIRRALSRTRVLLDLPAASVPTAVMSSAQRAAATRPTTGRRGKAEAQPSPRSGVSRGRPDRGHGTPWRDITLRDLVSAGLLRPPVELRRRYKGHDVRARIEPDCSVTWQARRLDSLSTAGGLARQSIRGPRADGKPPQTNGWTFWLVSEPDGNVVEVDALRRRLYERRR